MEEKPQIDIDHVARLARIELTDEERTTFSQQLGEILAYFDKIRSVDVAGLEPMAHAFAVENVLREDRAVDGFEALVALQSAPKRRDDQFVVPKVVDDA